MTSVDRFDIRNRNKNKDEKNLFWFGVNHMRVYQPENRDCILAWKETITLFYSSFFRCIVSLPVYLSVSLSVSRSLFFYLFIFCLRVWLSACLPTCPFVWLLLLICTYICIYRSTKITCCLRITVCFPNAQMMNFTKEKLKSRSWRNLGRNLHQEIRWPIKAKSLTCPVCTC